MKDVVIGNLFSRGDVMIARIEYPTGHAQTVEYLWTFERSKLERVVLTLSEAFDNDVFLNYDALDGIEKEYALQSMVDNMTRGHYCSGMIFVHLFSDEPPMSLDKFNPDDVPVDVYMAEQQDVWMQ